MCQCYFVHSYSFSFSSNNSSFRKVLSVLLCVFLTTCAGFNVDTVNYVRHQSRQPHSMFGFSVATHRERGQSWYVRISSEDVLVILLCERFGAPTRQGATPVIFVCAVNLGHSMFDFVLYIYLLRIV